MYLLILSSLSSEKDEVQKTWIQVLVYTNVEFSSDVHFYNPTYLAIFEIIA